MAKFPVQPPLLHHYVVVCMAQDFSPNVIYSGPCGNLLLILLLIPEPDEAGDHLCLVRYGENSMGAGEFLGRLFS